MAGRHITDAGTIALAFVILEFVGNDTSGACHSYEFGHEGGCYQRSSEPPSISVCGGHEVIGELNVRVHSVGGVVPPDDRWEVVNKGRIKVRVLLIVGFE